MTTHELAPCVACQAVRQAAQDYYNKTAQDYYYNAAEDALRVALAQPCRCALPEEPSEAAKKVALRIISGGITMSSSPDDREQVDEALRAAYRAEREAAP